MTDELRPVRCGCGGEAVTDYLIGESGEGISWYLYCKECETETKRYDTEAEAISAWNRAMSGVKEINAPMVKVERLNMVTDHNVVYKCTACGQYMHRTAWSNPVRYCSRCGCRLEWE